MRRRAPSEQTGGEGRGRQERREKKEEKLEE